MEDIGLVKQAWKWLRSQKDACCQARTAVSCGSDKIGVAVERHWPMLYDGCKKFGSFLLLLMYYWYGCMVKGFQSIFGLGSAALLIIMWSCFLSLTSISCVIYVLISMDCVREVKLSSVKVENPFAACWFSRLHQLPSMVLESAAFLRAFKAPIPVQAYAEISDILFIPL